MKTQDRQNGGMMVLAAGLIFILSGFAVLAVDLGRIFIVRNEMQNVADAAALAGANCLIRTSTPGNPNCSSTPATSLNWDGAIAKARDQLSRNAAAGGFISTTDAGHQIEAGYWNLGCPGTPGCQPGPSGGSFSTTFTPIGTYDKPAIRVSVRKDTGVNNGPIFMLTRAIYGAGSAVPMRASAVAVLSSPGTVAPGSVIPQAISKCLFDLYWDSASNSPRLATSLTLAVENRSNANNPRVELIPQVLGEPWRLRIGSDYHYPSCASGLWTTFSDEAIRSADVPRDLINDGNPDPLAVGQGVFVQPGTRNTLYNELSDRYPTLPVDLTVIVVDSLNRNEANAIVAFAGFRVRAIVARSGKYIEGSFIKAGVTQGASGIGPFLGTYTPPRIAN